MFSSSELPSPSSLFSAYASVAASMMLIRTMANDLIPQPARGYIFSAIGSLFKSRSSNLTLTLEEFSGITKNQIYEASEAYLSTKISPDTDALKISKTPKEKHFVVELEHGEKIVDFYEGVHVRWDFHSVESDGKDRNSGENPSRSERKFFKLSFEKKHKDLVLSSYLPHILAKAQSIKDEQRGLKLFTLCNYRSYGGGTKWDSINLEHPANFEILAMDPELKKEIIEDLDRFVKRKDFYRRVGKAWKRGYLLYGPPGTGKSSLVAAMANYLKFNIYDLQLNNIMTDSDLRRLLLTTGNKSILVIEDIDCSVEFTRENIASSGPDTKKPNLMLTLSGLLNFIDGLWSSCGDERIIVFTTNEKDKLEPALLRPGRMDMHIHMSYCKFPGFKTLASNYIGPPRSRNRGLYVEIEGMIKMVEVTPAEIAEELMKSEDADVALNGVVRLLKRKKIEGGDKVVENENENEKVGGESAAGEIKRAKLDNGVDVVNSASDA